MTDAKPQHDRAKRSPLRGWLAYLAWQREQSEARRKARLEASPVRLALLKRAAEKRARRRVRKLETLATKL